MDFAEFVVKMVLDATGFSSGIKRIKQDQADLASATEATQAATDQAESQTQQRRRKRSDETRTQTRAQDEAEKRAAAEAKKRQDRAAQEAEKRRKKEAAEAEKLRRQQETEEKKQAKEQEEHSKKATEGVKTLRNETLGMLALWTLGGGIRSFVESTISGAAGLGRMSANLNMSTKDLSAWDMAAESAGAKAGAMTDALKNASVDIARLKAGRGMSDSMQKAFGLGLKSEDLKDGQTYLLGMSRILSEMYKKDPAKALFHAQEFNVEGIFDAIKNGPAAYLALTDAQRKNAAISDADAKKAADLERNFLQLKNTARSTATALLIELWPSIEQVSRSLIAGANEAQQWVGTHQGEIKQWIGDLVSGGKQAVAMAREVAEFMGGWKNVLLAIVGIQVVGWMAGIIGTAATLAAAFGGVSGAVGGLTAAMRLLGSVGAVAAAGYAGWKIGELINDHILSDDAKNTIGEYLTKGMAALGNKDARESLDSKRRLVELEAVEATEAKMNPADRLAAKKARLAAINLAKPPAPAPGQSQTPSTGAAGINADAQPGRQWGKERGLRNNNPGNIQYGAFAVDRGAVGREEGNGGRFAKFATAQDGLNAMGALLARYVATGTDTVAKMVEKYAPAKENGAGTAAYIASVSKRLGVDPNQKLDFSNPAIRQGMIEQMVRVENGRNPYTAEMLRTAAMSSGQAAIQRGEAQQNALAATRVPMGAAAVPSVTNSLINNSTSSANASANQTDVRINTINVNAPQARNATDIAREIGPAISNHGIFSGQANGGLF